MKLHEIGLSSFSGVLLSFLRITVALTFFSHGTIKHFGFPEVTGDGGPPVFPPLLSLGGIAGVLELVGGLMLFLGLLTRPVSFLLSGMMAVAFWLVHAPNGLIPALNGGEAAYLFCFIFLFFSGAGAGPFSLDALWLEQEKDQDRSRW